MTTETERLRAQVSALREALQDVLDEQNGPPLVRREAQWVSANERARAALTDTAATAKAHDATVAEKARREALEDFLAVCHELGASGLFEVIDRKDFTARIRALAQPAPAAKVCVKCGKPGWRDVDGVCLPCANTPAAKPRHWPGCGWYKNDACDCGGKMPKAENSAKPPCPTCRDEKEVSDGWDWEPCPTCTAKPPCPTCGGDRYVKEYDGNGRYVGKIRCPSPTCNGTEEAP